MRFCIPITVGCILTSIAFGRPEPGFTPENVTRRVRSARREAPGVERQALDAGEFLVDTSVQYIAAPGGQSDPAVAFDGTNFLVVWVDDRNTTDDIFATRVTPQGTILDPAGIAVSTAAHNQRYPAVAFSGANFLVVWADGRDTSDDIYAARVSPQGTVLDPGGIPVSTAAYDQTSPAVSFDGANFLVVWSDDWRSNPNSDIHAARVTAQGAVLDPAGIAVSTAPDRQELPAIAFDGVNSLVTWDDNRSDPAGDIYAARVTPQGTVLDPAGIVVSAAANTQESPFVAFDDTNFLVAWYDTRSTGYGDVYAARVTPQGTVLDPSGIGVSTATGYQEAEGVAFDGTNFWVTWDDDRGGSYSDIYAARVTPQGTVLDPSGIAVSAAPQDQYSSAVAFDGVNLLMTWEDYRNNQYDPDVYAARVTPQGTVLDPRGITVSVAVGWQEYPTVAFDGADFLVTWTNGRSDSTHDVYATRVTPQGTTLDSTAIAVSTAPGWQSDPAIACDGTNCLVTWMDYRSGSYGDIYAARVTPQGTVLDPSGIPVTTDPNDQLYPTIAFDGTNYLVAWMDYRSDSTYDIYAARVTPAGAVLDPSGIPVATAANHQSYPAVAFDGASFLVTWMDNRSGSSYDIYAARVTPQGTVLDPSGIAVSTASNDQLYPTVAFDGANFLVAWTDERTDWQGDIYAARVTPQGAVLDPSGILVSAAPGEQQYPRVVFDGANFLVAWGDDRSGSSFDIYCARVTPAGAVIDSGPAVKQEGDQVGPALARGTGNQMFLVYEGWAGTVGGKTYNTSRIWGKFGPFPGVQERPSTEVRTTNRMPTIVRGVLCLPPAASHKSQATSFLFDASGRKVLNLHPGPNDVSRLAPGAYFLRLRAGDDPETRKVIIR